MYAIVYLLAAATTAIIALVGLWSARSSLHWFWRAAAMLCCFVLLVPVGAAELTLLFAPMAAMLFAASAVMQWFERRRQRRTTIDDGPGQQSVRATAAAHATDSGPNRRRSPTVRISLKEMFLVLFLAAVAAWVIARVVQEGVTMDWRKLPFAVGLVTAVTWTAYWWADKPRPWSAKYATLAAYLFGAATALTTMHVMIYRLAFDSGVEITVAAASLGCLAMFLVNAWLRWHGGLLPATLLVAAIYAAVYVQVRYLGDWLAWEHLLWERPPTFWLERQIIYGSLYALLAAFVLAGAAVWRGLELPLRESCGNWVLSGLSSLVLVAALMPLGWWYLQLLDRPQLLGSKPVPSKDLLADANRLVEQIQDLRRRSATSAVPAAVATLPDSPEMRRLTRELVIELEDASHTKTPRNLILDPRLLAQADERQRLMGMATQVLAQDDFADPGAEYRGGDFALAQVQYASLAQRQGLAGDVKMAYMLEPYGHMQLAMQCDRLPSARVRELIIELEELDLRREPLDSILVRDAAWSERFERWRSRLRRVVLGQECSIDSKRPTLSIRDTYNSCVATARMNYTNLAIRMFAADQGRLPSSLDELVPRYLRSVPLDPYSGQPLIYRAHDGKYVLYTVGADGMDNGGVIPFDGNFVDGVQAWKERIARVKARAIAASSPPANAPARAIPSSNSPTRPGP